MISGDLLSRLLCALRPQLQATIEVLRAKVTGGQERIEVLRQQLHDVKAMHSNASARQQEFLTEIQVYKDRETQWRGSQQTLQGEIRKVMEELRREQGDKKRLEGTILQLTEQCRIVDAKRHDLETSMVIANQYKTSLQAQLAREVERVKEVGTVTCSCGWVLVSIAFVRR